MDSTTSLKEYLPYAFLFCLFFLLQFLLSRVSVDNFHLANVSWYISVGSLLLEHGLFSVWTPYPPLFSYFLYFSLLLVGEALFLLYWRVLMVLLVFAIAFFLYLILRKRSQHLASLAAFGYILLNMTFTSTVTIGWYFDQFDYIPLLFLLASLYFLTLRKTFLSAFFCALGILMKLFPGIVLLLILFRGTIREKIRYFSLVFLFCLIFLFPFLFLDSSFFFSFIDFTASRSGWETVWHYPEISYPPIPDVTILLHEFSSEERPFSWLFWCTLFSMLIYLSFSYNNSVSGTTIDSDSTPQLSNFSLWRSALVLLLLLLFFAKGISSYFVFWLFPFFFVIFRSSVAFTLSSLFLLIANMEIWWYWESIFLRHALFLLLLLFLILEHKLNKRWRGHIFL